MQSQQLSAGIKEEPVPDQTMSEPSQPLQEEQHAIVQDGAKPKKERKPRAKKVKPEVVEAPVKEKKPRKSKKTEAVVAEIDKSKIQEAAIQIKDEDAQSAKKERKRKDKQERKDGEKGVKQQSLLSAFVARSNNQQPVKEKQVVVVPAQPQVPVEEEKMADVQIEQAPADLPHSPARRGRKPKKEAKMSSPPKKEEKVVEVCEKVKEWKLKREQFDAILRQLLIKGREGRENPQIPALGSQEGEGDQQADTDLSAERLKNELIRKKDSIQGDLSKLGLLSELNQDIMKVIGLSVESSPLNLAKLAAKCQQTLREKLNNPDLEPLLISIDLASIICAHAERKSYGVRSKDSILYEDESEDALWYWELFSTITLPYSLQKSLVQEKQNRQLLGSKIKSIDKLIQTIDKATTEKDLPKLVEDFEKYNKVLRKENAEIQKNQQKMQLQREKENKEKEKLEAKEKERLAKEQERIAKEQERIRQQKEREEAKERERLEKLEQQKQKEAERLEKKRKLEEEQQAKKEAEAAAKAAEAALNPHPSKVQKTTQQQNPGQALGVPSITSFFKQNAGASETGQKQLGKKEFLEDKVEESVSENKDDIQIKPFQWLSTKLKLANQIDSESLRQQSLIKQKFGHHILQRAIYTKPLQLIQDLILYKSLDNFKFTSNRRKNIIIEDSFIKHLGFFDKKSYFLTPRNPLKKDETLIDYDMSSEEEWNELNGEDVDANNKEEEEEDDEIEQMIKEEEDQQAEGFIVPDDYLSASELNLSQSEESNIQVELQERRKELGKRYNKEGVIQNMQTYVITYTHATTDKGIINYMEEFKAVAFNRRAFPIRLKEGDPNAAAIDEKLANKQQNNPNAINLKLVELTKMLHGSFESKQKIIDEFNVKHPECSKKSIERKIRDLFEKDKKGDDPRQRWYATESTLVELNLIDDEEMKALFDERTRAVMDEINKLRDEQIKAKEEQKQLKQEQKELAKQEKQAAAALEKEKAKEQTMTPNKRTISSMIQALAASAQAQKEVMESRKSLTPAPEEFKVEDSQQQLNKPSCSKKDTKKAAEENNTVAQQENPEAAQPKKNPTAGLNRFFKPMSLEDREKLLLTELQKVKTMIAQTSTVSSSTAQKAVADVEKSEAQSLIIEKKTYKKRSPKKVEEGTESATKVKKEKPNGIKKEKKEGEEKKERKPRQSKKKSDVPKEEVPMEIS